MQRIKLALIALALCCLAQQRPEREWKARGRILMAATVHTWTNGDNDGDWGNADNWDTAAVPGAGGAGLDTALFDGSVTQTGPYAGLDRVTALDVALFRVIVKRNFTGNIGASGNPLIHELDSTGSSKSRVIHAGTGSVYFEAEGFSDYAHVGSGKSYLDCTATPGAIRNLFVTAGYVSIAASCQMTGTLVIDGASAIVESALESAAGYGMPLTIVNAGTFTNGKTMLSGEYLFVSGGRVNQTGRLADGAIVIIGPAGYVTYTPAAALGAAYNPHLMCAGGFDASNSNYDVECDQFILMPLANVLGAPQHQGDWSPLGVDIDLREEYP